MIDPGIDGRVAIVTGANHGIGAAVARALAAQGVRVFLTYLRLTSDSASPAPGAHEHNRQQTADAVAEAIRGARGEAEAWECDLAVPQTVPMLFDRAESALGSVDILIHNAAAWLADTFVPDEVDWLGRPLVPVSVETHDLHFAVNSRATALLIAEFARRYRLREGQWGRIITVTTGGSAGFPYEVSYGAGKNALESYTMAAAWELSRFGITANVVCPPATDTGWIPDQYREQIATGSPRRRLGTPEEVADAVVFLVSRQADAVTGEKLTLR